MIQPIDEKSARYHIIKLMFDDKFQEAEELLSEYTASGLIDRSYSDFYYVILDAIGVARAEPTATGNSSAMGNTAVLPCDKSDLRSAA